MVVISAKRVDVDIKTIINPANRDVPRFSISLARILPNECRVKVEPRRDRKIHAMFRQIAVSLRFVPSGHEVW